MVTSRFELNGKLLFLQQSQSFSSPIVSFDSPKSKKLSSADFQIHFANGSSKLIQMKFHNFPIRKISNQENYFKEAHLQEILEIRDKYANEVDFFFFDLSSSNGADLFFDEKDNWYTFSEKLSQEEIYHTYQNIILDPELIRIIHQAELANQNIILNSNLIETMALFDM